MSRVNEDLFLNGCDERCAAIAASQYGVISRRQALDAGMTKNSIHSRLTSGRWERVLPRVYRLAGAPRTWLQDLMAAVLWAGDVAVVSRGSAAALFGLDGFDPGPIEVSVVGSIQSKGLPITVHRAKVSAAPIALCIGESR